MPLGSVSFDAQTNEQDERLIWLPRDMLANLNCMRVSGESYSDVILALAEATAGR
jgi:hypothetical protein